MNKIIVGVTGGISAYKSLSLISALRKIGFEVKVVATANAFKFVTKDALIAISGNEYYEEKPGISVHVDLAKWADGMIISPCTVNTLSKLNYGIADNLLTSTFIALDKTKHRVIALAMNVNMYSNIVTQTNLSQLQDMIPNIKIVHPVNGLLACGDIGIGKLAPTSDIIDAIHSVFHSKDKWRFPLPSMEKLGTTNDSFSYLDHNWGRSVKIPVSPHCGSYGIRRKHDVHKGVDLYAPPGTAVHTVEDGEVIKIIPFTGKDAGCPWWNDTMGIYVKGKSGIVVYGEVKPLPMLKEGVKLVAGTKIATVERVLKKDKGGPTSMLHLELHDKYSIHTGTWQINKRTPKGLLDPTQYLIYSI